MSAAPKRKLTAKQYLAIERAAEFKSEFYDGEMFMMSGARMPHVKVSGNLVYLLKAQFLKRECEV